MELGYSDSDIGTLYRKGLRHMGLKQYEDAYKYFDIVTDCDPKHKDAWFNKAEVLLEMERMGKNEKNNNE